MENKKSSFPVWSIFPASAVLTLILFAFCLVSMGAGHGSGVFFKRAFPLPYILSEFLYEKARIENSMFVYLILGFVQNLFYISIAEKLKQYFSNFISYSIIILVHLILCFAADQIYK